MSSIKLLSAHEQVAAFLRESARHGRWGTLMPGVSRLAIANANVPNMVGQISTCLAEARLNIADLLNKSRGDVAYTLLDTDAPIGPEVVVKLHAIPGVLSARLI